MRVSRIYYAVDIEPQQTFAVDGRVHHYLSRVLRLKQGHELRVFNGKGVEFLCTIIKSNQHVTTLLCREAVETLAEPIMTIKLYLAVSKNEAMDFSVQKATELGIQELQPLITEHSVTYKIAEQRQLHWQGVAISACEQCGRTTIPVIKTPIRLAEITKIKKHDKAIICTLDAKTPIKTHIADFLTEATNSDSALHLMIGSEGGFSADDVAQAISLGFKPVHLGDYVLRSETAVTVALGIARFSG